MFVSNFVPSFMLQFFIQDLHWRLQLTAEADSSDDVEAANPEIFFIWFCVFSILLTPPISICGGHYYKTRNSFPVNDDTMDVMV